MLVDRAVQVGPAAGDLDIGLVEEPAVPGRMPGWAGGVNELGGERLHPPIDGDVINSDAAFGEQFFDIAVGQAVAQVPAHRDRDHLARETVASRCG